ncbi:MAG: MarR family transcriptional regulator [Nitrospirae bacterium]|nr:MarR family transcriptional regulator [Candidatus Manganitrophaceae bacterium]
MDHVDKIIKQWHQERPDLDVEPMEVIGRILQLSQFFLHEMNKTFSVHGLNGAKFDVLATIRRSGAPYGLSPGDLMTRTMVTSGTITNRIDQLVKADLVKRTSNPQDARGFIVSLTNKGHVLIDRILNDHVKTQAQLTAVLTKEDKESLNSILRKLLINLRSL